MMASSTFIILAFGALACTANANGFLTKDVSLRGNGQTLSQNTIEQRFLEEVRGITGKGPADLQIPAIKAVLEPMWAALPKNHYGSLDGAQVKYALHRLFVQRHGWHIDGLTDISDKSSPTGVLKERVPTFLLDLFEEAFGQTGLKLHELAVFAATLERLIHDENIDRLKHTYTALEFATDANMSVAEADKSMQAFMLSLILGKDLTDKSSVQRGFGVMERNYPAWAETKRWLEDVRQGALPSSAADSSFNFQNMENATEQISMQLGGFLNKQCLSMKNALLEVEEEDSGRVLLSKYYQKGLEKGIHFVEKLDYLRKLGAIDDSQPGEPRVIVPNVITSQNNCLVDTGSYRVCCLNECEGVMAQLERTLGVPEATPDEIVAAISGVSTTTITSPRVLPQAMILRLELVGERNGGKVPLYGRLFSQWLHFAFPRECPYPQLAGSATPLTPEDYTKASSERATMALSDLHAYIGSAEEQATQETSEGTPEQADSVFSTWSDDEEVFFVPTEAPRSRAAVFLRGAAWLVFIGGSVFAAADVAGRIGGMGSHGLARKVQKEHLV